MFSRFVVLMLAITTALTFAQSPSQICRSRQDSENETWARKAGLSKTDVQEIRATVPGAASRTCSYIVNLDSSSLKAHDQILLVEGAGSCIRIHVVEGHPPFANVWSLGDQAITDTSGQLHFDQDGAVCSRSTPQPPSARVTEGKILLEVPSPRRYLDQRTFPPYTFEFVWNGRGYEMGRR